MSPIKTALIGYGFSARTFHQPFLEVLYDYQLTAVSTRQTIRTQQALPDAACYASAKALIDDCDAELVIITTPNDAHFPLAKLALESGRHVVVDKPFVCTVREGQLLIEIAERQGRLLSVFHNRRWDGDFLTLKQLKHSGRLGKIRRFESHFDRFRPLVRERWREQLGRGTGIWFDLGPHLVDQALQLFGKPNSITGRCRALRDHSDVTDYFHILLHYDELEVILHSSPFCAGPNLRFQVEGDQGSYRKFGLDPQEGRLIDGRLPLEADWALEDPNDYGTLYTPEGREIIPTRCGGYQHYYQELAGAIRSGASNPVSASEALEVIRILELAQCSNDDGCQRLAL